jgi:hypothetical protein
MQIALYILYYFKRNRMCKIDKLLFYHIMISSNELIYMKKTLIYFEIKCFQYKKALIFHFYLFIYLFI